MKTKRQLLKALCLLFGWWLLSIPQTAKAADEVETLIIQLKNGTENVFFLKDKPKVTFEGADLKVSAETGDVSFALADVLRGVNMFRNPQVNKPIYGLVENMAWFTPEAHPEEKYYLFGKDGGAKMAADLDIPLLGRIPLVQGIREGGDDGTPVALLDRPDSQAFLELARKLAESV